MWRAVRGWLAVFLSAVRVVSSGLLYVPFLRTGLCRLGFEVACDREVAPWSHEEEERRHRCGSMRLGCDSIIAMCWRLR